MGQSTIKKALIAKLQSIDLGFAYNFPNLTTTEQAPYADVYVFFSQPSVATLGAEGEDGHRGFLQVTLNMELGQSDGPTLTASDLLRENFKAGVRLVRDGIEVVIMNCGVGGSFNHEGKYVTPVTINWYTRVRR